MGLFAGIVQTVETSSKAWNLPYKEEVAGSNPASPTCKLPANNGILYVRIEVREAPTGPFAATRVRMSLQQHHFHHFGGGVLHGGSSGNFHSDNQQESIVPNLF